MLHWYQLEPTDVLRQLGTDSAQGLSSVAVTQRLAQYGPNELQEQAVESPWLLLWKQLTATMVLILIAAAIVSAALGDYRDAIAIVAIVIFNAALGFKQEYQAEQAMAALKKLAVPTVRVRRDGAVLERSARDLVPGDIVRLEAGNLVPADCRVLRSINLRIEEASLTGESEPTDKTTSALSAAELPVGDRHNMAYMGTMVTYGHGMAVVTDTGMSTELGKIAQAIQTATPEPTQLQKRLDQLGKGLAIAILILITLIFGLGLLRGEDFTAMFLTAVSLGVAAVPEGLPAVVTIALALGAQRMFKQRALIRKLPAVETLGSVTVICSDKTGTLTENRMTVTFLSVAGHHVDLSAHLRHASLSADASTEHSAVLKQHPILTWLLTGAALCNDASLEPDPKDPQYFNAIGDPTEGALVVAAAHLGLWKVDLEHHFPRVHEIPFDADRKRMTTVHPCPTTADHLPPGLTQIWAQGLALIDAPYLAFTKGAVDHMLQVSSRAWVDSAITPLNQDLHQRITYANNQLAQKGMRVLGLAMRPLATLPSEQLGLALEQDLVFLGIVAMIDPPRPEVKDAVLTCKRAGIRPVMITGDHPLTAQYIAQELGIATDDQLLTGQELAPLTDHKLNTLVEEVSIYARVTPQHKLDIVQALQQRGHIVAMTGDGVNDAPALKKADIGVAMGITGTDVAKQAADMVLLDDNFTTIVAAVREGRVIYDNIRKFIKYTLTGNGGELWVIILAPLLGMPLPLLPLQILWINLLADGLLALALSVELAECNIMNRPPFHPQESVFSRGVGRDILWLGLLLGLVLLGVGYGAWNPDSASHLERWRTLVFTTLALSRIGMAQTMRSERDSLFQIGVWSNRPILGAVILTFGLQLMVLYIPFLQRIFQTTSLSLTEFMVCLLLAGVCFWAYELKKWLIRCRDA